MRCLVIVASVLAGLVALPVSASAQGDKESTSAEPSAEKPAQSTETHRSWLERSHPEAFVDPTKPASGPALKLGVDSGGLEVTPAERLTPLELRIQVVDAQLFRSRAGLIVSAVALALGGGVIVGSVYALNHEDPDSDALTLINVGPGVGILFGAAIGLGGLLGVAISGARLPQHKRELHRLQELERGTAHRVQWDLQTSRLVF